MSRSINKAIILGNLTRDPEMRYTPQGSAVTSFAVATNRQWNTEDGSTKEAVEFHNIVAWNKLAEICSQLLKKGAKVYIEGRLQTRNWEDDKAVKHYKTEIVADDMIVLTSRGFSETGGAASPPVKTVPAVNAENKTPPAKESAGEASASKNEKDVAKGEVKPSKDEAEEVVGTDEMPF